VNFRSPHNIPVIYLDRNFGSKIVPTILRNAGIECEIHDDHLKQDAKDEEWIDLCSKNSWLAITKDSQIKYNAPIKQAIKNSNCGIVIFTARDLTGEQLGELLIKHFNKIVKFYNKNKIPFVGRLTKNGQMSLVKLK